MQAELARAAAALERGDYGQCLTWLKPLAELHPLPAAEGANIRMMMVTAWMGQGEERKALATCRLIARCNDPDLRQSAKQLLTVLEAPSLERPANWSIKLPPLDLEPMTGSGKAISRHHQRKKPNVPPPPPTGPTKAPSIGFAVLVLSVLLGLMLLLSGCLRVTTDLQLSDPDRIGLSWQLESSTQRMLPWQISFERAISDITPKLKVSNQGNGEQLINAPRLSSRQANSLLNQVVEAAASTGGIDLPSPELLLNERNWLIGLRQDLSLIIDLTELPEIPGLELEVHINPPPISQQPESTPKLAKHEGDLLTWVLQPGSVNKLVTHAWIWSKLGLGTILVMVLLCLSVIIQSMRLKLGFGFPELPA